MSKIKLQTDYTHYALFEPTTHDNTVKGATVDGLTVVDVWRTLFINGVTIGVPMMYQKIHLYI